MRKTMNISLTDDLHRYVLERVEAGSYGSASEYIRTLLRRDKGERVELKTRAAHPRRANDYLEGNRGFPGSAAAAEP